jgi:hypothetical protein
LFAAHEDERGAAHVRRGRVGGESDFAKVLFFHRCHRTDAERMRDEKEKINFRRAP